MSQITFLHVFEFSRLFEIKFYTCRDKISFWINSCNLDKYERMYRDFSETLYWRSDTDGVCLLVTRGQVYWMNCKQQLLHGTAVQHVYSSIINRAELSNNSHIHAFNQHIYSLLCTNCLALLNKFFDVSYFSKVMEVACFSGCVINDNKMWIYIFCPHQRSRDGDTVLSVRSPVRPSGTRGSGHFLKNTWKEWPEILVCWCILTNLRIHWILVTICEFC